MFLRFVISELDDDSERELGIFHAAWNLRDDGRLFPYEETHLEELRQWFNLNLEKPTRFTASKPPYYRKKSKAISWFRDSAHEHVARIREIAAILENHGITVRMLKAERVGYLVYEDKHQVVAEPFSDIMC
jgi:hypothetical protein